MSLKTYQNVNAFVVENPGKPGIILLQEWWGLNDQIKGLCQKFADAGFSVISPDLYHGKVAKDASEANHLMSGLDFPAAVKECGVWMEYLKTELKAKKVGVTGFCMGGALSIACASKLKVNASAPFYGIPSLEYFPVSTIECPIQLHFGGKDDLKGFSDPAAVEKLVAALKSAGKTFTVEQYPDAGHAFMNEKRPEAHRPDDAKKAFAKTIEFFKKNLE